MSDDGGIISMETARQKKGSSRDGKNAVKLVPDSFVFGLGDFEKTKQQQQQTLLLDTLVCGY